ncbi:hypothetical protein C4546_02070 [Candidatus Parcubacteria bacterium]|jgi:hypothetical protein|nr:MAG: hypothetical protein C4546_02070 [Candidatus Parcubacteria bacterium]
MKNHLKFRKNFGRYSIAILSVLALIWQFSAPRVANAGTMTVLRMYLNRQQADVATGVQFEVFFTPVTNVSGGSGANSVIFVFPNTANHNTKWCRTVGTGDLVITGITDPTGGSETATALPGTTKTGACTQTPDTFTISGVDNLTAGTKYGFRVAMASSTVIGTTSAAANDIQVTVKTNNGSGDIDTGTLALSIIAADQVSVTATVTPTLTVTLSGTSAALGTLTTANVNQAGIDSTVTTNAGGGYISMVKYNNTLTSGASDTIDDTSGGTIVAGTEEFGASSSDSGNTIAQWSPAACSTTATTSNATALTTAFQSFASSSTPVSSEAITLCFLASVSGTTPAGSYTSTATLVTTAKF